MLQKGNVLTDHKCNILKCYIELCFPLYFPLKIFGDKEISNYYKYVVYYQLQLSIIRGLSREKIESVDGLFSEFDDSKADSSQQ